MRAACLFALLLLAACELKPFDTEDTGDPVAIEQARIVRAQVEINTLRAEMTRYYAANGEWPPNWASLKRSGRDPWGHAYAMHYDGDEPIVYSAGRDGQFDTDDDVYPADEG